MLECKILLVLTFTIIGIEIGDHLIWGVLLDVSVYVHGTQNNTCTCLRNSKGEGDRREERQALIAKR